MINLRKFSKETIIKNNIEYIIKSKIFDVINPNKDFKITYNRKEMIREQVYSILYNIDEINHYSVIIYDNVMTIYTTGYTHELVIECVLWNADKNPPIILTIGFGK